MQVAVLTFDNFGELDSFVAAAIINRRRPSGWAAPITAKTETVTSVNGVMVLASDRSNASRKPTRC